MEPKIHHNPNLTVKGHPLFDDDALFITSLRSRSPSCLPEKRNAKAALEGSLDNEASISTLSKDASIRSIEPDMFKIVETCLKAKKPLITLRMLPLDTEPMLKMLLRLKQPQEQLREHWAKKFQAKSWPIPKIGLMYEIF